MRRQYDDLLRQSLLERLARKIEPKSDKARSVARRIRPMKEIEHAGKVFRPGQRPRPTTGHVELLNGEILIFYSDGSLRHGPKMPKVSKRQRRHVLRFGQHAPRVVIDDPRRDR